METNEELRWIMEEVQKNAELKKVLLQSKLFKDSAVANGVESGRIGQDLENIRSFLQLSLESFHQLLEEMENGKLSDLLYQAPANISEKDSQGQVSEKDREQIELEESLRKRFCVNKECKYSFTLARGQRKSLGQKRCLKCGSQTISIISTGT